MSTPLHPAAAPASDELAMVAHYREMYATCGTVLTASLASPNGVAHAEAHSFVLDLEAWLAVLRPGAETVLLESATREYQHALLALTMGQYRHAFAALRLFLELALAAVLFSSDELTLREWLRGLRDSSWRRITRSGRSVFSQRFARAFCPDLQAEAGFYGGIATKTYRECSEFVHGNTGKAIPFALCFDQALFDSWHDLARSARLSVSFALTLRYLDELTAEQKETIEPGVTEQVGHIATIRIRFGSSAT